MIKAVSFDYGGVLNQGGTAEAIHRRFTRALGVELERFGELAKPIHQIYRGKITPEEFWQQAANILRVPLPPDYQQRWQSLDQNILNTELYDLATELRQRGIKTAITSNITVMSTTTISQAHGYDGFDAVVLSCEVGFAKPDPEIYHELARRLDIGLEEIIHLDDQDYCLEGAAMVGMQTLKFKSVEQAIEELRTRLG